MKKLLTAVTAATLAVGAAAQSSVTLFGVVDVGVARVTGNGTSRTGLSTGGANISRLGFRGVEDLGGGLAASFWLEAGLDVDTGQGKTGGALSFNRRSTVSLAGRFGEVRLGRDDAATFLNTLIFDPFLTNGVGGNNAFIMLGAPIQISNAVSYFLPPGLGGFYAQLQYAFGEQPSNATNSQEGNYVGLRAGYRAGPVHVALATGKLQGATDGADIRIHNFGASYDFGVLRPSLLWAREKRGTAQITAVELGVTAPLGLGELRAQASRYDTAGSDADWKKFAIGYGYNLSKRTQLYATVAHLSNQAGAQRAIGVQGLAASGTSLGGSSNGYELGLRHTF
ncbi:porin [Ramlibacter alkalitolerans]|uniref:Porin n=1 Tax=Ramlibacter alkalitolerans TaxID=2039631 RepID=A0ABS1JK31_9BURK|nr:porin [Ramlibacter alkalitolerans]MBL0424541.1 porin [Ramlibacter alkalitolerans]